MKFNCEKGFNFLIYTLENTVIMLFFFDYSYNFPVPDMHSDWFFINSFKIGPIFRKLIC